MNADKLHIPGFGTEQVPERTITTNLGTFTIVPVAEPTPDIHRPQSHPGQTIVTPDIDRGEGEYLPALRPSREPARPKLRLPNIELPLKVRATIAAGVVVTGAAFAAAVPVAAQYAYNLAYDATHNGCSKDAIGCAAIKGLVGLEDWLKGFVPGGPKR